jgi:hypothetical protein
MPERCRWVNNCFVARYHSLFSIASSPLLVCITTKTYHKDISVIGIYPLLGAVDLGAVELGAVDGSLEGGSRVQ